MRKKKNGIFGIVWYNDYRMISKDKNPSHKSGELSTPLLRHRRH